MTAVSPSAGTAPPVQFAGVLQLPPAGLVQNTTLAGGAIANAALVATGNPGAVAVSVYPLPGWLIRRSSNVTRPDTASRFSVPERMPPTGLVPIAIVMLSA